MTDDNADLVRAFLPPTLAAEYDADVRALDLLNGRELGERFPDSDYDGDRFVVPPTGVWMAHEIGVDPAQLYMPRWLRWCRTYVEKWWVLSAALLVCLQIVFAAVGAPLYVTFVVLAVALIPNVAVLAIRAHRRERMDEIIKDLLDERLREHGGAWFSGRLSLREVLERRVSSFETCARLLQELHDSAGKPVAEAQGKS